MLLLGALRWVLADVTSFLCSAQTAFGGPAPVIVHGTAQFRILRSIKTQVLSAGLAEFSKEIGPALVEVADHLVQGAIGPKVGLTDCVQYPFSSRDHWSGRYEPYPPDQGIDLDQVRDIVLW